MSTKRISLILVAAFIMAGVLSFPLLVFAQAQGTGPSQNKSCVVIESNGNRNELNTNDTNEDWTKWAKVSIPIPGVTGVLECTDSNGVKERYNYVTDLGTYLAGMYQFFVGIVGILGAVMIMYGGIRWVLAAGNQSRIQSSKDIIFSAIIGIIIAFTSYLLLYLLNPKLVNYENLALTEVTGIGSDLTKFSCTSLGAAEVIPNITGICSNGSAVCPYRNQIDPSGNVSMDSSFLACGDTGVVQDPGRNFGSTCTGLKCYDSQGNATNGMCVLGNTLNQSTCISSYLMGRVEYVGGAYIDRIKIGAVCNNGEHYEAVSGMGGDFSNCVDFVPADSYYSATKNVNPACGATTDQGIYTDATNALNSYERRCSDEGGLAGYYLNVEINDDQGAVFNLFPTTDDNFAVDKNCQVISAFKDPEDLSAEEWRNAIAQARFIKKSDLIDATGQLKINNGLQINCNISRQSFIAR